MTFKLQGFGINESQYERPNQPWICGWSAAGEACRVGPDAKGQCRATFECAPIQREGRSLCTRPRLYGGPCENGPLPAGACSRPIPKCQPVRSLRARRGRLAGWASAVTAGLLALALGGRHRGELFSPGELGFQHGRPERMAPLASLLTVPTPSGTPAASSLTRTATTSSRTLGSTNQAESTSQSVRCGDCHGARPGLFGPLAALFGAPWSPPQSQLCLNCHVLGEYALKAHSQPPATLAQATWRMASVRPVVASQRSWECATCHTEHRGGGFPIAFMENRRCQACHARTFDSLASGHPEFENYPYGRGLNLKFDHNKHKTEYFFKAQNKKEDRPFECRTCHVPDPSGRNMLVRSFEQTCATCHAAQIADNDGVPFLTVPGFDAAGLKRGKARIGEWPNHDESDLSPFMRLLLVGGGDKAAYLDEIKGVDLLDLGHATDDELDAVQAYAWGVKRLIADLSLNGAEAVRLRLAQALSGKAGQASVNDDLVGEIQPATIDGARRAWFPHLMDEMKSLQGGAAPPVSQFLEKVTEDPNVVPQGIAPKKWLGAGGWYRDDADFTMRYRPTRHADAFLRAWLDLAAGLREEYTGVRRILEMLNQPTSPGRCLKCHTLAPVTSAASLTLAVAGTESAPKKDDEKVPAVVHWTARHPSERAFNKFAHTTHFSVFRQAESCFNCHLLASDAPQRTLQSGLMASAAGDFVPMPKLRCLSCHVPKAAGDNCVLCHNYHVGVVSTTMTAAAAGASVAATAAAAKGR